MATCRWWECLLHAATSWFRYYVAFHKSVPFITALVFSHSLVKKGTIQILIVYLSNHWSIENYWLLAIVSNVFDGLSEAMSVILEAASDKWTGHFLMVIISTVAYVVGIWLLYFSTKPRDDNNVIKLFCLAMLPTAMGRGGEDPTLSVVFGDQMRQLEPRQDSNEEEERDPNEEEEEEERVESRMQFWVRIGKILGSTAAFLWFGKLEDKENWSDLFKFSAIVIMAAGILFVCGLPWYYRRKPTGSPFDGLCQVLRAAIRKRGEDYPRSPVRFHDNRGNETILWPHHSLFRCLRWIDKAAIITTNSAPQEQERKKLLFPVAKVKRVKLLLAMTPLWAPLFIFALAVSAGNSFFYLQAVLMDRRVGSYDIPFSYLTVTLSLASATASLGFGSIVKTLWKLRSNTRWRLKFGLAIFCFFLSCIAARLVEAHRFKLIKDKKYVDVEEEIVDMNVLWLTPQFWLYGFAEGFCSDGLKDFCYDQRNASICRFSMWPVAWGSISSIVWIWGYHSWFLQNLNSSQFGGYYVSLAILCFVNLVFYLWACNLSIFKAA